MNVNKLCCDERKSWFTDVIRFFLQLITIVINCQTTDCISVCVNVISTKSVKLNVVIGIKIFNKARNLIKVFYRGCIGDTGHKVVSNL